MAEDSDFTLVDPEIFRSKKFSVDAFLVSLTKDVIGPVGARGTPFSAVKDALSASEQVQRVQRLLGVLERAEGEVQTLHQSVTEQVKSLQETVNAGEEQYRADVAGLESCVDRIKGGVRDIDARVSKVSQTATRIGDRLQTAEAMRVRCLEAFELLTYLQAFSCLPGEGELGALPKLFTDDHTMAEAAAVSRRLSVLAGDVASSKARKQMVRDGGAVATPGSSGGVGSVEHTVKMLQAYCSQLEHRVIARFDAAAEAGDEREQAECVRIMVQCDKERTIAQRWVSTRPMFLAIDDAMLEEVLVLAPRRGTLGAAAAVASSDTAEASFDGEAGATAAGPPGPAAAGAAAAAAGAAAVGTEGGGAGGAEDGQSPDHPDVQAAQIRALSALYKEMHASVKQEVATAKAIFPRPDLALELFIQRLFEQDVQLALEKLLGTRGSWAAAFDAADPSAHRAKLRLLAETYARTGKLAANCERALRGVQVDVCAISEGLWPSFLGAYPLQELAWLEAAFRQETAKRDSPELSLQLALTMMGHHREATSRVQALSTPAQAPRNVRTLFHHSAAGGTGGGAGAGGGGGSGGGRGAHPGCLLEQLARHIAGGVEYSLELCTAGGSGALASIFRMGLGSVSRASSAQMAQAFVNDRIRRVLEAAHLVSEITTAAQAHFEVVVLPAVAPSVADHGAAAAALLALLRAAEESVTAVLRRAVDVFVAQFERVLYSEQRRSDFQPRDDALSFDRPTPACLMGTGMLYAMGAAARDTLDGPNMTALLSEVGRRTHAVLVAHMSRYTYSPTGALKWKKDVAEYGEALAGYGVPAVDEEMAALEQVVNVLVVAPESLMGLVNGSLRMAHRDALRIISLREDFKTAKVDGKTLGQLFSGAVEGVMSIRV